MEKESTFNVHPKGNYGDLNLAKNGSWESLIKRCNGTSKCKC